MKPLHLKIAGLNSFREEQEVDFSALGETGVFGIFGPTGSGKSSILDAITLALYGKVERAKNGTQGIINQNEDKLYVYFSFQIGDKKYSAERTYKRGNDGSINQANCRFMELSEGGNLILAEKKREMDEKVQEILGLNVDDFTRAVVLPQGKFQEFLTLQGSERRKMLQRIFALEKYGDQLVKRIRERLNKTQLELEMKRHEQEVLGDASETAIIEAQKALEEKLKVLKKLEEKLALLNKQLEEYQEIRNLTRELKEVDQVLMDLASDEPLIKEKEEKLNLAQKGEYLRPYLNQVNEGKDKLNLKELQKEALVQELEELQNSCTQLETQYKNWENKYQLEGKELEGRLIKLDGAIEDEKIRDGYNAKLLHIKNEYEKLREEVKKLKEEKDLLEKRKQKKEAEKNKLEEIISEKEVIVAQGEEIEKQNEAYQKLLEIIVRGEEVKGELEEKVKQAEENKNRKEKLLGEIQKWEKGLEQIQEEIQSLPQSQFTLEEIYQEQTRLQASASIIETFKEKEKILGQKTKELSQNNELLAQQEKVVAETLEVIEQYQILRNKLSEEIVGLEKELRRLEKESFSQSLRESLVPGEPCPVCGSLDHPTPIQAEAISNEKIKEVSGEISAKKHELSLLEEKISEQRVALANGEANLKVLQGKETSLQEEIEKLVSEIKANLAKLPENWQDANSPKLHLLLEEEKEKLQKELGLLEEREKAKKELDNKTQDLQNQRNSLLQSLSAVEAELKLIESQRETLEERYNKIHQEVQLKKEAFTLLAGGRTGEEVQSLFALLKTTRKELQELQQRKNGILKDIDSLSAFLGEREKTLNEKEQMLKVLENEGKTYRNLSNELTAKINQITGGEKGTLVKARVEAQLKTMVDNLNKYKEELSQAKEKREEKSRAFHTLSQEILTLQNDLEKYQKTLQEKMEEYQFISLGHLEDAMLTEAEREELANEIKKFNDDQLLAQERKNGLLKKLGNRQITEEQWTQFLQEKSQVEEEEKEAKEESLKLKLSLEDLKEKHARWKQLVKEIQGLTELLDQLTLLDKLFKGNTFVEFIAEEQLIHVAIDASRRLGELTGYRYALEVDSEGGFIIRDDANGGLRRPVTSLSGGETFLTSLALALALSSQIQLRGKYPLEFFFLDEGFGTLDNHLLETVMSSLERLQLEKMTIGIISHVPELKARIPRSLIVEPAEKGGRGSRLKLERI